MFYVEYRIDSCFVPEIFRRVHGILNAEEMIIGDRIALDFIDPNKAAVTICFIHPIKSKLVNFIEMFHSGTFGKKLQAIGIYPQTDIKEYAGDSFKINLRGRNAITRRMNTDVYVIGDLLSYSNKSKYTTHISSMPISFDKQWKPNGYGLSTRKQYCTIPDIQCRKF